MKVNYNPRTGIPEFELDENDMEDAYAVKFFVTGARCPHCNNKLPEAWNVLKKYWDCAKDSIIVSGMDGIRTRAKRDLSDIKWAILKGFIELSAIPDRIVKRADEFIEKQQRESIEIGENTND